uniref:Histidine kinase n=1 Tax=Roseihalotalea indica TaxID=2867963 RepID=A0AA49JJG5_9BACT|nr:histidine kinase [Tunicatimonas sp. TK19036]
MKSIVLNERIIRIIGIPLVGLFFMLLYSYDELTSLWITLREFAISLTFTFVLWEGNRAIVYNFRKWYPHNEQTPRRLLIQTPISIVFTIAVSFLLDFLFRQLEVVLCEPGETLIFSITNLIPTVIIISIYEGAYFFEEWKKNFQRSEALAKENIRSQFEALKSQLDPHFLFNSLNTLAALIDPENDDAQKYLEQLADVYRYVLLSRQKETVLLREELEFVQSYIYLNKTRYRDNLLVQNDIPEESLERRVAPLSLQILVENALKHNIISKDKPLTLSITVDRHGYVVVENNVQKKNILEMEKSTKTGLENIVNRYALLTPLPVEINQSAELFSVRIPLIVS